MGVELVESRVPQVPLSVEPVPRRLDARRHEGPAPHTALLATAHETGLREDIEMLREGRQRHPERRGEFERRARPARQALHHGAPRGIGERAEDAIERRTTFRHVPK